MQIVDEWIVNEIKAAETDWVRGAYVPWQRRRQIVRLALIGASLERVATKVEGPIAAELRRLIEDVDQALA